MTRKTGKESFIKELKKLTNEEYEIVGNYINASTEVKTKHSCGYIMEIKPTELKRQIKKRGKYCAYCYGTIKRTTKDFKKEVYDLVGDDYKVLGSYKNKETPIKMKHKNCGNTWYSHPNGFLRGNRCPKCNHRSNLKTTREFKEEVCSLVGSEYEVLSDYKGKDKPIKIKHNKCNKVRWITPHNFLGGNRCPYCNLSKGEDFIKRFLENNSIKYKREYTFNDCKYETYLRFDFAINEQKEIKVLIEYDGIQHYEPVEYFGGQAGFEKIRKRDWIKNEYCEGNEIPLIRIPYWELNNGTIEETLENRLTELGILEQAKIA